jgi:maltooligosyltrehalose trehalohydrolase
LPSRSSRPAAIARRLPIGAELAPDGVRTHFRVWAPRRRRVAVALQRRDGTYEEVELEAEPGGYFAGWARARARTRYGFRLDGGERPFPDPASRSQPDGPHGLSAVVEPMVYQWHDARWPGPRLDGQVMYELHLGTFTPEGTWAGAARELPRLAELGVTTVEVMPVAEFPGRFGWGYDGVDLFAPHHGYGTPDDMRRFVDDAHSAGIAVILDVVYNHLGPDGNYLREFSAHYFSDRHHTDWGEAINFDGPECGPVRELYVTNARYWIDEYHLDGLRLDATQDVHDDSPRHVLADIAAAAREAARERRVLIVAENEPQDTRLLTPVARGGMGIDAAWNDDFHHTAEVALTGHDEAYLSDYRGHPQEFVSAAKHGYLYQGQRYQWQRARRGSSTRGLRPAQFVAFLENHDQVSNIALGSRLHTITAPGRWRALTAWLLLGPHTPLLFQGQEYQSTRRWVYFADHGPELAPLVFEGRKKFLAQFANAAEPSVQAMIARPDDLATFASCRLDPAERERNTGALALHADLLWLRRHDPVIAAQGAHGMDGAVLGDAAFCFRWLAPTPDGEDRLLLVNHGRTVRLTAAPVPLLAPPPGMHWRLTWHSEEPRYGGHGMPPVERAGLWHVYGESAALMVPEAGEDGPDNGYVEGSP